VKIKVEAHEKELLKLCVGNLLLDLAKFLFPSTPFYTSNPKAGVKRQRQAVSKCGNSDQVLALSPQPPRHVVVSCNILSYTDKDNST
jgi:hypothetical protein